MATKRSAPSSFDDKSSSSRPYNKRHRFNNAQPHKPLPSNLGQKSFKKAHSVNDLKSSVRSLKRLLTGPNSSKLPATIRSEKERALQTAEQDLKREQAAIRKDACISRWHKVRFFDRQKGERRLKKARKVLKTAVEEDQDEEILADLRSKIEERENEVNYAIYYPLDQEYVPLFPTKRKGKDGGESEEKESSPATGEVERQGDAEMWDLVRTCAKEGRLKDLREGRLRRQNSGDEEDEEQKSVKKNVKTKERAGSKQKEQDEEQEGESDNESGGGFFE